MFRLSSLFFFVSMIIVIASVLLSNNFYSVAQFSHIEVLSMLSLLLVTYFFQLKRISAMIYENVTFYMLFFIALSLISFQIAKSADQRNKASYFEKSIEKNQLTTFIIRVEKTQDGKSYHRYECEVLEIIQGDIVKESCGRLLLFVNNKIDKTLYKNGSIVMAIAQIKPIENPKNSISINWKKHYEHKGIYHQGFIKTASRFRFLERQEQAHIHLLESVRLFLKKRLRKCIEKGETFALLSAMILGDKTQMTSQLRDGFSKSGVMHVLAVSGLHVGIVYLMLSKWSYFISILIKRKINGTLIILVGIWLYALITGFSASVIRASFMFTLIAVARSTNGKPDMINILSCSACILTLIDPLIIYQIGFQLSHLAVAGIVLLYPFINAIISFKNGIKSNLWSLISVSIAAQLSTFPLAVYYFNIFPNYFLLSNLIAVPLSGIIISLGIALIAFSDFGWLATILSQVLSGIVGFLQKSMEIISELPGAVSDIQIDPIDVVLIYLSLILLIVLINFPGKRQLYLFMTVILITLFCIQTKELFNEEAESNTEQVATSKTENSSIISSSLK